MEAVQELELGLEPVLLPVAQVNIKIPFVISVFWI